MLMFATVIVPPLAGDLESTKSIPHSTVEFVPDPKLFKTRTA